MNVASAYTFAWRNATRIPEPVLRALFTVVADVTWLRHGKAVRRMEANYARVRPDLDAAAVRRLSRAGMRSYMRYFREAFTLQGVSTERLRARVRLEGYDEHVRPVIADGGAVSLALGHLGNWDLAGAYGSQNLAGVLTVTERLKPAELFDEFVRFRGSLGIEVLPLGGGDVLGALVRGAKEGGRLIPLLSDRDLTSTGIEVDLAGHRARVAAGPALVGLEAGVPVHAVGITYERLHGARRRAAGTPWGIVIRFYPPLPVPDAALPRDERARLLTQGWVDQLAGTIVEHTQDWHMLQRVFVADLGPARQRASGGQATG
ncbi:phosphatidylinositol mannoside acyltransferase [Promicromonospora thailandica]|uniref:KDO2-lipid IV(A) lauroyltransferase n=1 Tax=Promicromonospora thailandica TaxID=765201 RepID=A0A9X2G2C8_9MICO|nr:phosphatidylinositol mannoside acyltransferase [Promicromonospora thailandica]MCP2265792.1 KDO2-lipid IV(A) lauroyltransferase [Promicromonospora thailandica]BFF21814.1 phosphatidylinositol mannoside acyltransferase [Promicromonospora thailandica]